MRGAAIEAGGVEGNKNNNGHSRVMDLPCPGDEQQLETITGQDNDSCNILPGRTMIVAT